MLIRRSDWTLQALFALALLFGAATAPRAFAGVDGTDCNCGATGAYLVPDPGVRPVGAVEVILVDPRASVDFIADGVHVHPAAIRAAVARSGVDPAEVEECCFPGVAF